MYEFWYDYAKPKYGEKAKLCYMDTDSFIIYIKTDGIYKDSSEDKKARSIKKCVIKRKLKFESCKTV